MPLKTTTSCSAAAVAPSFEIVSLLLTLIPNFPQSVAAANGNITSQHSRFGSHQSEAPLVRRILVDYSKTLSNRLRVRIRLGFQS